MSVFFVFLLSFGDEVSNRQYHDIVTAAREMDCFVKFIPSGENDNISIQLVKNFLSDIDSEKDIIFTISSNPYDPTSHYLYDRVMLDDDGYSDEKNYVLLANVIAKFLLRIGSARKFLFICSEGYDVAENFATADIKAAEVEEYLTAILFGDADYVPSIMLRGTWD